MQEAFELEHGQSEHDSETNTEGKNTLVRKDLAEVVHRHGNLSREEADKIIKTVLDLMVDTIASGQELKLHGFGKFQILHKNARVGRNPRTGVEAEISARRSVSFRPSPNLVEAVNGK